MDNTPEEEDVLDILKVDSHNSMGQVEVYISIMVHTGLIQDLATDRKPNLE
jgi:hypothetical protein